MHFFSLEAVTPLRFLFVRSSLVIIAVLSLITCATTGPKFSPAATPPAGQGLVYMARDSVHYGGAYATVFYINDVPIATLRDKGYSWTYLDAGTYKFRAGGQQVSLTVAEGKTYYLGYHQSTGDFGSRLTAQNYLQQYPKEKIYDRLVTYRYNLAKPTEAGFDREENKSSRREYQLNLSRNAAKIKLSRSDSLARLYPTFVAYIYDNAVQCKDGKQFLLDDFLSGKYFTVTPNQPVSLNIISSVQSGEIYRSCHHRLTFTPDELKSYTIELNAESLIFKGKSDRCTAEIIQDKTGQAVAFLERKDQLKFVGSSPECSRKEFEEANYMTTSEKPNKCYQTLLGERRKCFF